MATLKVNYNTGDILTAGSMNEIGTQVNTHTESKLRIFPQLSVANTEESWATKEEIGRVDFGPGSITGSVVIINAEINVDYDLSDDAQGRPDGTSKIGFYSGSIGTFNGNIELITKLPTAFYSEAITTGSGIGCDSFDINSTFSHYFEPTAAQQVAGFSIRVFGGWTSRNDFDTGSASSVACMNMWAYGEGP